MCEEDSRLKMGARRRHPVETPAPLEQWSEATGGLAGWGMGPGLGEEAHGVLRCGPPTLG